MRFWSFWVALVGLLSLTFADAPAAATLTGRITDLRGAPLGEASVQLLAGAEKTSSTEVRSDDDGVFRLSVSTPGRFRLVVSRAGFCTWRLDDLVLATREQRTLVAPFQPGARVTGSVKNAKGEPLSEVRSLEGVNLLEWLHRLDQVQQQTQAAGRVVRVGGLPVGEVSVVATPRIGKGQPIVINTEIRRGEIVRVHAP